MRLCFQTATLEINKLIAMTIKPPPPPNIVGSDNSSAVNTGRGYAISAIVLGYIFEIPLLIVLNTFVFEIFSPLSWLALMCTIIAALIVTFSFFSGKNWARIAIFTNFYIVVLCYPFIFGNPVSNDPKFLLLNMFSIFLGIGILISASVLLFSRNVRSYQEYRINRSELSPPLGS